MKISEKALQITPFIVMEVLERAKQLEKEGKHIIHLEVGEPDFDIPEAVKIASIKAIEDGYTHYSHSLGDIELRNTIVDYYAQNYNVKISADQVVITSGSSPAILLTLSALLNPDDEVIISDPGYACYANFINYVGGKPVVVKVNEEDGFQYKPEAIKKLITNRSKALFINSPMNPTGNLLSAERLKTISELGVLIISDEIYHGLTYGEKAHSILEFTDNAVVISGFSKLYAMTGLRLGYLIAPNELIRPIQILQQNLFISANSISQRAGIAALTQTKEVIEQRVAIYNERRLYLIERLKNMGFGITVEPTGAFYVFVNAKHLTNDVYKFAFDILENAHVGVTPGTDFGANGEGYLRFSYANSIENIKIGMDRLEKYISNL